MNLLQNCSQRLFSLSLMTMGLIGAIAPSGHAIERPTINSPSLRTIPRTASGAPRRCPHNCVKTNFDFDGDGQQERVTPATVLTPQNNVLSTKDGQIQLFVYLPEMDASTAELIVDQHVTDSDNFMRYREVYFNDAIPLPGDLSDGPRIVAFTFDDLNLEPGEIYEWMLSFRCGENDWASPYSTVSGLIIYEESTSFVAQPPETARSTPNALLQTAQDYLDRGLWSEALQLTAQARTAKPEAWEQLLASQGLECFKNVPLAGDENVDFAIADDPRCFIDW